MKEYFPDNYTIMLSPKSDGSQRWARVIAGWSGSYTSGHSWKASSPIVKIEVTAEKYRNMYVYTESGGCYRLTVGGDRVGLSIAHLIKDASKHGWRCVETEAIARLIKRKTK